MFAFVVVQVHSIMFMCIYFVFIFIHFIIVKILKLLYKLNTINFEESIQDIIYPINAYLNKKKRSEKKN